MNCFRLLWDLYTLKRNEHKTASEMRRIQERKLRELLAFAYEHSAYYRRTFEAAGITAANVGTTPLSAFPTVDKAALLEHFDELITVSDLTQEEIRRFDAEEKADRRPFKGNYHVVHSSGSTGKPGYFVYDTQAWNTMLLGILRGALWNMDMPQILRLLARGPHIAYIAATDGRYGGAMAVGDGIDGVRASQIHLDIKTPLAEWIRRIREFKPNIVIGYPSAIKILAGLAERGQVELRVARVISCGEPLGGSLRNYLEEVFHTRVVNFYGASESLALGVETDPEEGMILFDDMNVIEARDGCMYLTCLYNFAQPLIRYRISDSLTLRGPDEGGGSPFTKAVGLLGRNEDLLWFADRDGNREFLHPLSVEGFCIEGLRDYQFRQTGGGTFEILAQTAQPASRGNIEGEMRRQMKRILAEKNMAYVRFDIRFVDEILPDPRTGKKRLIVKTAGEERLAG